MTCVAQCWRWTVPQFGDASPMLATARCGNSRSIVEQGHTLSLPRLRDASLEQCFQISQDPAVGPAVATASLGIARRLGPHLRIAPWLGKRFPSIRRRRYSSGCIAAIFCKCIRASSLLPVLCSIPAHYTIEPGPNPGDLPVRRATAARFAPSYLFPMRPNTCARRHPHKVLPLR